MLFSPYFWLLIAALMAGSWMGGCTHEKKVLDGYKAEVEADRLQRVATVARIDKERTDAVAGIAAAAAKKDASRDVAFLALRGRNRALADRLAAIDLDRSLVDSVRDTIRTANGPDPGPAAQAPPDTAPVTAAALADWVETVGKLYAAAREQIKDLIAAYDGVRSSK